MIAWELRISLGLYREVIWLAPGAVIVLFNMDKNRVM